MSSAYETIELILKRMAKTTHIDARIRQVVNFYLSLQAAFSPEETEIITTELIGDSDKLIKRRENAYERFKTNIAAKAGKMLEIYNRENEERREKVWLL